MGGRFESRRQGPIRVIYDPVVAGFNVTLGRDPTAKGSLSDSDARLLHLWQTPKAAAQWAVEVLGDVSVRTFEDRPTESTAGFGLLPKIAEQHETLTGEIDALVKDVDIGVVADDELEHVSSHNIKITVDLIEAISELPQTSQSAAVSKIASEVAMARTLEKAMTLRRLLLTGRREANIAASPAMGDIATAIAEIDREIENLLFEKRLSRELQADTAAILLDIEAIRKNAAGAGHRPKDRDALPVDNSAINK